MRTITAKYADIIISIRLITVYVRAAALNVHMKIGRRAFAKTADTFVLIRNGMTIYAYPAESTAPIRNMKTEYVCFAEVPACIAHGTMENANIADLSANMKTITVILVSVRDAGNVFTMIFQKVYVTAV